MCYYNSRQLGLLQISTTFVTIYDSLVITILDNSYYNLRRLLLQFTIGITIHYRTHLPTEKVFYATATTKLNYSTFLLIKKPSPEISDDLSLSEVEVTVPTTSIFLYFFYLLLLLACI